MNGRMVSFPVQTEFDPESEWPWYRLLTIDEAISKLPWGWEERDIGHLYVLVFTNDAIKIGSTKGPRQRVKQHRQAARNLAGLDIEAVYFTAPHTNFRENESEIHKRFPRPTGLRGKLPETYQSLTIQEAIDLVHSCDFQHETYLLKSEADALERELAQEAPTP